MGRYNYEADSPDPWPDAVSVPSVCDGVAFYVLGWETEPDEDTEWSGMENRTGSLVVCMVGDNNHWRVDPEDIVSIAREEYCGECGQIGCAHDGLDRSARGRK